MYSISFRFNNLLNVFNVLFSCVDDWWMHFGKKKLHSFKLHIWYLRLWHFQTKTNLLEYRNAFTTACNLLLLSWSWTSTTLRMLVNDHPLTIITRHFVWESKMCLCMYPFFSGQLVVSSRHHSHLLCRGSGMEANKLANISCTRGSVGRVRCWAGRCGWFAAGCGSAVRRRPASLAGEYRRRRRWRLCAQVFRSSMIY